MNYVCRAEGYGLRLDSGVDDAGGTSLNLGTWRSAYSGKADPKQG
jgi:hypothetical protein